MMKFSYLLASAGILINSLSNTAEASTVDLQLCDNSKSALNNAHVFSAIETEEQQERDYHNVICSGNGTCNG